MSESTRYQALNDSIFTERCEDILIDIAGPERLSLQAASIAGLQHLCVLVEGRQIPAQIS